MPLRDEFPRQGTWLFRWRSYLPSIIAALVLLEMRHFSYFAGNPRAHLLWELVCLAISLLGLVVRATAVGCAPRGTSGRNTRQQVAEAVNTTGAYSVVRHPLYLGNYLMWLGVVLFPHDVALAVIVTLAFWLYYERIMFAEEEFLAGKFGRAYVEWAARTPAFVPDLRRWRAPSLPFSFRNVLKREYTSILGVLASFAVLDGIGDRLMTGRYRADPLWTTLLLLGVLLYIVLRTLRRRTRVLDVEGR